MAHLIKAFVFAGLLAGALAALSQSKCIAPMVQHPKYAPLVYQTTDYTCGPAALLSLLNKQKNKNHNEMSLAKTLGTTVEKGTMPAAFIKGMDQIGLKSAFHEGLNIKELKKLYDQNHDLIPLIDSEGDHWVLITDFTENKIVTMDPWPDKCGYVSYSYAEFNKVWHGDIGNQAVLAIKSKK